MREHDTCRDSRWHPLSHHALAALTAGVLLLAAACATNPVTGEREFVLMSEAQELALGQQADGDIQRDMGVYDDPALQEYIQDVGLSLAAVSHRPDLPWQFTVIDSPAVNAFALPGGYIYLTRGIIAYLGDEAELAGVLGHEIGHVTARHAVQSYTRAGGAQLGLVLGQVFVPQMRSNPYGLPGLGDAAGSGLGLLFLRFGRDDEIQADRLGAEYASDGELDERQQELTVLREKLRELAAAERGRLRDNLVRSLHRWFSFPTSTRSTLRSGRSYHRPSTTPGSSSRDTRKAGRGVHQVLPERPSVRDVRGFRPRRRPRERFGTHRTPGEAALTQGAYQDKRRNVAMHWDMTLRPFVSESDADTAASVELSWY